MEAITIYECNDGTRFDAEEDAKEYESLCARVKEAMKPMGERTSVCNIGEEYIQHDLKDVRKSLHDFLVICTHTLTYYGPKAIKEIKECIEKETYTDSVDNVIASCAQQVLVDANYRFSCTNMKDGREYPHPYYTIHEDEFKD